MTPPEVWLRGPIAGIPAMLQPVAHSLLQCREEVRSTLPGLTAEQVWARPNGAAAAGFHVRHAIGSLDRLLSYARGEQLSEAQRSTLATEEIPADRADLAADFDAAVARALEQIHTTDESTLLEPREVGRARLPSTVIGLLFHAAEHTQRHIGQLVTTSKIVRVG